ncbi:MAG: TolC family protein [Acidobacteriia bacterium]|nr:TolC family protein [Terriglobia bacterium]
MRLFHTIRRTSVAVIAAAITLAAPSVFAQSEQSRFASSLEAAAAQAAAQSGGDIVRRISVDDAVKLALEQNLGIRIQRLDPQIQDMGVAQAQSAWAPNFTSALQRNSQVQQSTNALAGGATSVDNGTLGTQIGLNQTLPWGGSYSGTFNNSRVTTSNFFAAYSPQLNSTVNVQYTQPLLRNYSIDQIRQQVASSKKTRDLSDIQLQSVITGTLRGVKNAYWDLVYTIDNLKAQQQSLALSQQFLKDNQKRVEIGTLAPIDIVQAQAEVAANEQGVIVADAAIKQAQDALRALVLDPGAPDFWNIDFEPTDAASFAERAIDIDAAVRNALDKRSDLHTAKNSLEQSDINLKFFGNQIKPDVNAQVNYIAAASGGQPLASQVNILGQTAKVPERGYGTVLGDVLKASYPTWTVGVQIGYPLGLNIAKANLARARLQYEQSQSQLKNLEMQVATQVRTAARNVQTNQKRVQSAKASRELQEKKLEAEEKKLAAGMSQSFFVFQAQRDLALARTAEIQAIADYNKSLVDFEAVQEVPLNGGGGGITIAGR